MSRSWKTTILGLLAVAGVVITPGTAHGGDDLWASATIEPGREGIVEVGGYAGTPLGAGSVLTLTAPSTTTVTGTPITGTGYRGSVAPGGSTGTYTFEGAPAAAEEPQESAPVAWKDRKYPFLLSVPADAEPGTRLPDCALVLRDADGTVRQKGTCTVTVGLPAPSFSRPHSGVPLNARPKMVGTAYPGAQVTVRDAGEEEICATTTAPSGVWWCTPGRALPPGTGRLQATATLNGVSATSEQIDILVTGSTDGRTDTVSDSAGGRLQR
ncbi:carboxypeptidase regulatory-like domain-containing protein [Streptomyces sp. AC550_RSS872]|uniref:carboxypeptidase regulatory-like domain-containing protein n=1 Tax=Streptomyces sp. AC550_RSS872 TaxID=2823689 RepID=UPI001C25E7D8|nr:carboxypeptidase regulatory-like domain-containing protein [Streptomyces sp. AC550_RSS872]